MEKGTMWSRRWWKVRSTTKFVSAGFLTCWQRSKNFSENMFPHNFWNEMLLKPLTSLQNHDGLQKLVSSLWSRNRMKQHEMVSHNTATEKGADYNVLRPNGHSNYLRVLKDAYRSRFCSKGKPSVLFITFRCSRSFIIHCVKNTWGRWWSS